MSRNSSIKRKYVGNMKPTFSKISRGASIRFECENIQAVPPDDVEAKALPRLDASTMFEREHQFFEYGGNPKNLGKSNCL